MNLNKKRGGLILKAYPQEIQEVETTRRVVSTKGDGLSGDEVRAIVVDRRDNVWLGTNSGLSKFDGKVWTNFSKSDGLVDNEVTALCIDQKGSLWIGTRKGLSILKGKRFRNYTTFAPPSSKERIVETTRRVVSTFRRDEPVNYVKVISCDSKGQIWLSTPQGLFFFDGKVLKAFDAPDLDIRAIAGDEKGNIYLGTSSGLWKQEGKRWVRTYRDEVDQGVFRLLSNDVRSIVVDKLGNLWIGSAEGVNIYDGRKGWYKITGKEGLPTSNLQVIALGPQGERWFGGKWGAAKLKEGRWHYYASKRWLPNDDVRAIALQKDGTAWLGTAQGVSKIGFKMMTLEEKAKLFERRIRKRHTRYGFVNSCALERPGDPDSFIYEASDNDGSWTALYLTAESFRYAVTKEEEAKRLARQSFRALVSLEEKTPIDGFPARAIVKKDERIIKSQGEWHDSPDGDWQWKGDTSSDEIVSHFFAYSIYYDLVAGEREKEEVRKIVRKIADHLLRNDFNLIDLDGKRTTWGVFSPKLLNEESWFEQRGLNSLQILSHLKVAYHITSDQKYQDAYLNLIKDHHYALNTIEQRPVEPAKIYHHDDELAFLTYYPLLKYEEEEDLRAIYLKSLRRTWEIVKPKKNPNYNFIYGTSGAGEFDLEESVKTLQDIPLDLIYWTIRNSHREDIKVKPEAKGEAMEVLPHKERPMSKWDGNPYRLDGGHEGRSEDDGAFFLLPYWLGRYYGFIVEQ